MAESLDLRPRLSLQWSTYIGNKTNPSFTFMGSKWKLSFDTTSLRYNNDVILFKVRMYRETPFEKFGNAFNVTTFVRDPGGYSRICQCNVKTVDSTDVCIWSATWQEFKRLNTATAVELVILFDVDPSSRLEFNSETLYLSTQKCFQASNVCGFCKPGKLSSFDKCTQAVLENASDLEKLSQDLDNLLVQEILPDVKLKCVDHTVSAHKAVLAARSEVFAAMFRNKMTESETGIVDVKDLDVSILNIFLKYLYSGKIENLDEDIVHGLYTASDKYAVHSMKNACSERMKTCLTKENCLRFLILADAHNDEHLKDSVINFVSDNLASIEKKEWSEFKETHPKLSVKVLEKLIAEKLSVQA